MWIPLHMVPSSHFQMEQRFIHFPGPLSMGEGWGTDPCLTTGYPGLTAEPPASLQVPCLNRGHIAALRPPTSHEAPASPQDTPIYRRTTTSPQDTPASPQDTPASTLHGPLPHEAPALQQDPIPYMKPTDSYEAHGLNTGPPPHPRPPPHHRIASFQPHHRTPCLITAPRFTTGPLESHEASVSPQDTPI